MKIFFLFIFLSFFTHAGLDLTSKETSTFRTGELVSLDLSIGEVDFQKISTLKLKNLILGDTFVLIETTPFERAGNRYKAIADIVFLKEMKEGVTVIRLEELGDFEVKITNFKVDPVAGDQKFSYIDIPLNHNFKWYIISGFLFLFLMSYFIRKSVLKQRLKRKIRFYKIQILDEIILAKSIQEFIKVWERKNEILDEFPELKSDYLEFKVTIEKYMFRPSISESQLIEIQKSHEKLYKKAQEIRHGI